MAHHRLCQPCGLYKDSFNSPVARFELIYYVFIAILFILFTIYVAYPLTIVAQDTLILLQQFFIISKLSLSHMQHTINGRMAYAPVVLRLLAGYSENKIKGEHLSAAN